MSLIYIIFLEIFLVAIHIMLNVGKIYNIDNDVILLCLGRPKGQQTELEETLSCFARTG